MLALLVAVSVVGVQYEHPQQHFTVDLPKDWKAVEPQNDPQGVIFNRNTNDRLTICMVRAVPVGSSSLQDLVLALAAATQSEPGYKAMSQGAIKFAGGEGYRRRFSLFIDPQGQFTKTVEERVIIINHVGYVVHVEGFTRWFNSRTKDFDQIFKTFSPPHGSLAPQ
jgi:hypothetical protein